MSIPFFKNNYNLGVEGAVTSFGGSVFTVATSIAGSVGGELFTDVTSALSYSSLPQAPMCDANMLDILVRHRRTRVHCNKLGGSRCFHLGNWFVLTSRAIGRIPSLIPILRIGAGGVATSVAGSLFTVATAEAGALFTDVTSTFSFLACIPCIDVILLFSAQALEGTRLPSSARRDIPHIP